MMDLISEAIEDLAQESDDVLAGLFRSLPETYRKCGMFGPEVARMMDGIQSEIDRRGIYVDVAPNHRSSGTVA